jgi:hypothetical protein
MVRLIWQQRRYAHVEAELWDFEVYEQTSRGSILRHYPLGDMFAECGDKFSRLQRMQNAAQSKFKEALRELEHLQAGRQAQTVEDETFSADLGFVPSTLPERPTDPRSPTPDPRAEVGQALPPAMRAKLARPSLPLGSIPPLSGLIPLTNRSQPNRRMLLSRPSRQPRRRRNHCGR